MGRKGKAELLNLLERIMKLYNIEHKTLDEIALLLQGEGLDISRSSIARAVKSTREAAADFNNAMAEARVLIDSVRDNPGTDIAEAGLALMAGKLLQSAQNVTSIDFDDPSKMIEATARIAQATASVTKVRHSFQKGFETAKKAVLAALKEEMKGHPDILERMAVIVEDLKSPKEAA